MRFVDNALLATMFIVVAGGCTPRRHPLTAPSTPLPPSLVGLLGSPCRDDTKREFRDDERPYRITTRCSRGRVWTAVLRGYSAITGIPWSGTTSEMNLSAIFGWPPITVPAKSLGAITYARDRPNRLGRSHVRQITFYSDGWILWIVGIDDYASPMPTAALTVVDRRDLTADEVHEVFDEIIDDVPMDDDDAISAAVRKVPSLGPGRFGELPRRP